jgi:hypothetical protein
VYKEERSSVHAVFKPHVRMGRVVGYSRLVPGSYLVLDGNRSILTRQQVYCKEYPGLIGLENLRSEADPIDDDGKLLEYEIDHELRMRRDSDLMRRTVRLPGDRVTEIEPASNDENYWHASDLVARPKTRQRTREREAQRNQAALLDAIKTFVGMSGFALPQLPTSMEEALAGHV